MVSFEYREIVKVAPVLARREVFDTFVEEALGNISEAARMCGVSRATVRKIAQRFWAEGEEGLKDRSRRPQNSPRKTPEAIEVEVVKVFEDTNYGFRRIARELKKQGITVSYGTVGKILKRWNKYKPRRKITIRKTGRRYYNPLDFKPFEFLQVDVKEVIDGDTLPEEVYLHLQTVAKMGVPMFQFTAIDVRTRVRFIAYGQEDSFSNGWAFMILVVLWLRSFGVMHKLRMQTDWGEEFGGKSAKKLAKMNELLAHLDTEVTRIHKGRKEENGYVERSHRTDDEEFYIPFGKEIKDTKSLFATAYSWIRYYNTKRPHYGKELDGKTPLEYTKEIMPEVSPNIALFPPVFLDELTTSPIWEGGNDLCEHYKRCDIYWV